MTLSDAMIIRIAYVIFLGGSEAGGSSGSNEQTSSSTPTPTGNSDSSESNSENTGDNMRHQGPVSI